MSLAPPIPIVLVGLHAEIGAPVAEGLRPEFDVIRFIQSYTTAQSDLPHLLQGKAPPNPAINCIGSADYSHGPARGVLFGRGFSQSQVEELYAANKTPGVVWIGSADATRPSGAGPPPNVGEIMVPIFRGRLEAWVKEGGKGGLVLY